MKSFRALLPIALVGIALGTALASVLPPPAVVSRLALCIGAVCGAVYGLCFWLNRFGHLSDGRGIGYLVALTAVPATVLVLARVPYAATYLGAGFLIGSTTFIVLSARLLDVIGVAPPNRASPEAM
jgi:FtsH-binding integral membrane protein